MSCPLWLGAHFLLGDIRYKIHIYIVLYYTILLYYIVYVMYIIILLIEEGGAGMVLEGLNKELAVREPPGLGIKEGAAISNTLTLKMEAQDI